MTLQRLPVRSAPPRRGPVRVIAAAAILLMLAMGLFAWWLLPAGVTPGFNSSVERAVGMIRSWGTWGMAVSIALMVAHSFLPFPAEVVALANGMVYGPVIGSLITWVGAMLGGSAAFGLTRLIGRPMVERLLSAQQQAKLVLWSRERGGIALLLSRLIPVIAFNLINYAAALTGISWWTFLWATGLGILPFTILLAIVGDRMLTVPLWAWLAICAVAVLAWLMADHRMRMAAQHQEDVM